MNLADKIFDHVLGNIEVGDHAIPQRPNRLYIPGCPAKHLLCLLTDGQYLLFIPHFGDGHYGRLVQDNVLALNVDEGISGSKINRHVRG